MTKALHVVFEKRLQVSVWAEVLSVIVALLGAFAISAGLIATSGANVGDALAALYTGAFGTFDSVMETLVQATPLIVTGLATVVAFRAKVWNIGAEGQFFAGAIAAAWISMNLTMLPHVQLLIAIILGATTAGALWGGIAGFLKARFGASEIIVTVMMNYIIRFYLSYLLSGRWNAPGDSYLQTPRFGDGSFFPTFFNSRLHLGFWLSLLLAAAVYWFIWRTSLGYEIRAVGVNPTASRYKGVNINLIVILVMAISGAIAGFAGGSELSGVHHRLRLDISTGYGFAGILVAMLGRLNPFGVVLAAVFFGALINGSTAMQIFSGVPVALVYSVQGIVLVCLLAADVLTRYRVRGTRDAG
jgi:ABC-type uncharacterized transport system permease subunit